MNRNIPVHLQFFEMINHLIPWQILFQNQFIDVQQCGSGMQIIFYD